MTLLVVVSAVAVWYAFSRVVASDSALVVLRFHQSRDAVLVANKERTVTLSMFEVDRFRVGDRLRIHPRA